MEIDKIEVQQLRNLYNMIPFRKLQNVYFKMKIKLGYLKKVEQELCYILHVALVFLNPFYRDTTHYYTTTLHVTNTTLSNYSRSVSRLHHSYFCTCTRPFARRCVRVRAGGRSRDNLQMVRKNLDEGATPLLIIHLLIQYLLLLQTMIPNSQLIFLPSAKRGLRKN